MNIFKKNKAKKPEWAEAASEKTATIDASEAMEDRALGQQIKIAAMPDFEEMAKAQMALIDELPTFHPSAAGFFAPELEDHWMAYCDVLASDYERYSGLITTTYAAALKDELSRTESRLEQISHIKARGGAKKPKAPQSSPPAKRHRAEDDL